jgi:pilus assembly protein CpaF
VRSTVVNVPDDGDRSAVFVEPGLVAHLHQRLLEDPEHDLAAAADRHARELAPLLPAADRQRLVSAALARANGLGPLEPLLADPGVTELLVNAGTDVWVERRGRLERVAPLPDGMATVLIERVIAPLGLRIDRTSPLVDARLADGSRVHAAIPPVAIDGPCLAIRRFAAGGIPLQAFASGSVIGLLERVVRGRANVVVSGPTSSGKTTLLNALVGLVPPGERVITIEDAAELQLDTPHVVRLEARPASVEGLGEVPLRALVRAALRLRPDRLVIGEVRGAEALDMVLALNTGHDGSLTTCHGNGPADALRRIEAMVVMGAPTWPPTTVADHVRRSIDVVVHVVRGRNGHRRIAEVIEVEDPSGDATSRVLARDDDVVGEPRRTRAGVR